MTWKRAAWFAAFILMLSALNDGYDAVGEYELMKAEAWAVASGSTTADKITTAVAARVRQHVVPGDRAVPFLRSTALDTWQSGEGHCGDAARVMVLMLQSLGIRAHRIYLRNSPEDYFHVALAYEMEGGFYLTDTVNSTESFAAFAKENAGVPLHRLPIPNGQFYSYSYANWSRVPPFIRVDQTRPFPHVVAVVLESPFLLLALAKIGAALTLALAGLLLRNPVLAKPKDMYLPQTN